MAGVNRMDMYTKKINKSSVLRDSVELKISIGSYANQLVQPIAETAHFNGRSIVH